MFFQNAVNIVVFEIGQIVARKYIIDKILSDVKGRMIEDIVLLEVKKTLPKNKKAFKYKFVTGGEFDMVIVDKDELTCKIYEIKHSDKVVDNQARFLLDKDKCALIEFRCGKILKKCVLYRGETETGWQNSL